MRGWRRPDSKGSCGPERAVGGPLSQAPPSELQMTAPPIGIFDSGVGGLTVARAVIDLLPHESVVYFGDTARFPYGPKPQAEVRRYALESLALLLDYGVKLVVVACNTASAAALDELRAASPVPVVEVIGPAVWAAARLTRSKRVGVIGTAGTIASERYQQLLARADATVEVHARPCPRFVDLVERGETTGPQVLALAQDYLGALQTAAVDTLVLGCTHYPLLTGAIGYVMGPDVLLVSSAEWTAREVFSVLTRSQCLAPYGTEAAHRFLSSGDPEQFRRLGARFLGPEVHMVEYASADRQPQPRASAVATREASGTRTCD